MYALSIRFVDVLNLVQVTIGTHIFISLAKQSSETLKPSNVKSCYRIVAFIAIIMVVLAILIAGLLPFIFGNEYYYSGIYLMILSPIIFIW